MGIRQGPIRPILKKLAVVTIGMLMVVGVSAADKRDSGKPDYVTREVRHELVMLPLFDNLAYRVDRNTVTLFGQVTKPTLTSDAESRVKHIEGVDRVIDNTEVLPAFQHG